MYLISYDICGDKKRRNIAKELENYGKRVQYSVFECDLDKAKFNELYQKLIKLMNDGESLDSVRIYSICKNCMDKTVIIGSSQSSNDVDEDDDLDKIFIV